MKTGWLLIILLTVIGCAPYIPVQEPANSANTISSVEAPEITIRLQHLNNEFEHQIFDLEVINHDSILALAVLPHQIVYYHSPKPFPPPDGKHDVHTQSANQLVPPAKPLYARSPEYMTHIIERKIRARATAQIVFSLVGAGIAAYSNSTPKEKSRSAASKAVLRDIAIIAANTASGIAGASAQQAAEDAYYLPHEIFPDVKLSPGQSQRGKLFFALESSHRYARVIITLPYGDYVFDFKKKTVK